MNARAAGIGIVLLIVAVTAPASAQAVPAAPDVVRLRDGGLLRGTIAELQAGDHVTIVLVTGETRRIAAADFTFAGPVEEAPRPGGTTEIPPAPAVDTTPPPSATAPGTPPPGTTPPGAAPATTGAPAVGSARIRVRSPRGERVIVDAAADTHGTPRFARVCTTPCALEMPTGAYHIALTRSGLPRLTVEHLVPIEDRDLVMVDYETRSGTRTGGYVLMGIAGAAGIGIALAPLAIPERSRDTMIVPAIIVGAAIIALGTVVGLFMLGADDTAHATIKHHDDDDDDDDDDEDEEDED